MSQIVDSSKPFGQLFSRLRGTAPGENRTQGDTRKALQDAAQLAIQVEFTTIPPYMTALYSISDPDTKAYQLLRSVMVEEMFHLNQAANLLIGIGGRPRFTGKAAPTYPCYLPHSNPNTTPFIGLCRASPQVFEDTFAAIETPAPPHAPALADYYSTIAQLYDALIEGMESYSGTTPLFQQNADACQRTDIYVGKFGGKPVVVDSMETAKYGVRQIVQQGEGSIPPSESLIPIERWATYNQYGERTDGTYGPILGTPYEMSHFKKFRTVALDVANFPPTYPIVSNPKRSDFSNPVALKLVELFDMAYSLMLDAMEHAFFARPQGAPDTFFTLALPLMHQALPNLARSLMTTPLHSDTNGNVGPNGAPTYIYQAGCHIADLGKAVAEGIAVVKKEISSPTERSDMVHMLESVHDNANQLAATYARTAG